MTYDEAGANGSLSPLPTCPQSFRPGALTPGTRILCLIEDLAYAERDILPVLRGAGLTTETMGVSSPEMLSSLIHAYQAILFDINSETSASFQVCKQIRKISGMPVMLVLHGAARDEMLHAYQSGADACILAPFDSREFLARLGGLLRRNPRLGF